MRYIKRVVNELELKLGRKKRRFVRIGFIRHHFAAGFGFGLFVVSKNKFSVNTC